MISHNNPPQYRIGDDFFGWTLMGWGDISKFGIPATRMVFFRKVCPTIDDADEIVVMNGQSKLGAMFCIRNGITAILPHEFSGIATQP